MHDTIPSGKDTCKPARSSDLSRGQSKDSCPNMRMRTCRKIRNKVIIKKNQPSHAMIHGHTKLAMRTPTHTPCTQLLPRHGTKDCFENVRRVVVIIITLCVIVQSEDSAPSVSSTCFGFYLPVQSQTLYQSAAESPKECLSGS